MKETVDKKIIILVLIIMGVSVIFICRYIWPKYKYVPQQAENQKPIKSETKVKAVTPQEKTTSSRKEYRPDRCILKKNISNREEIIFDNENCNLDILKWKDYLIFLEVSGHSLEKKDIVLYVYNMKNDEKTKIYSLNENIDDYDRKPRNIYLGEIFDNTLFFNAGGYATDQFLYSLDLSNIKLKPKLVSNDDLYNNISYLDGNYWISGGIGDAGVSVNKRALFDIKKQEIIGQTIETSEDLGVGTEYIGADDSRAFIAVFDDVSNIHLSEIYSLDLIKKKDSKTIISKKEMPPNIFRVVYMYDKKNFVLFGDDAYVYNLEEKDLKKIVSLKNVKFEGPNTVSGNTICIAKKLKLDIKKKAVVVDETNCVYENSTQRGGMSKKVESFKLPPEYSFEFIKGE